MVLFSIIIPTKNRGKLLKEAIQSVLSQKYNNFEIIVVDDHSDDHTQEIVYSFNDDKIVFLKNKNYERSAARNTGLDIARGEYICFLDDDDYYTSDYLQDFYEYLSQNSFPKDKILRTGFIKKFENGKEIKSAMYNEKKHKNAVRFAAFNMCGIVTLCIPKHMLTNDRFDERFPHWQDTHLMLRLFIKYTIIQLSNANYIYRIHNQMGSILALDANVVKERCQLNIDAINDLFEQHPFNNSIHFTQIKERLISEKYIQYAVNELRLNKRKSIANEFLRLSMGHGIYCRNYKHYIYFILEFIKLLRK